MVERKFGYQSQKDNSSGTLIVRIFTPEPTPEDDWDCKYILTFPEKSREGKLIGMDNFQALLLALKMVKTLLVNYTTVHQLTITWLGADNLGLDL